MKKIIALSFPILFILGTVLLCLALWSVPVNTSGAVKSIGADMIVVTHQSQDGMKIQELTIEVDKQTQLKDIATLDQLKTGDKVQVQYKEDGGRKVAVSVARLQTSSLFGNSAANGSDGG